MAGITMTGDWKKAAAIVSTMAVRFQRAVTQALVKEGQFLRGKIVQGIASGAPGGQPFAPVSSATLAIRSSRGFGGSKPLNVTGALRGAVTVVRVGGASPGGGIFVGLLRQGAAIGGKSPANLGEIHEFGREWVATPKQRRFLFAMLRNSGMEQQGPRLPGGRFYSGGGAGMRIRIPARPFMAPVFQKYAKPEDVKKRFWENVSKSMGYDLGGR